MLPVPEPVNHHPSDSIIGQIADHSSDISRNSKLVKAFLTFNSSMGERWSSTHAAALVASLVPDLEQVSYDSFRSLTGYLNLLRKPDNFMSFNDVVSEVYNNERYGANLKGIINQLKEIRDLLCTGKEGVSLDVNIVSAIPTKKPAGLTDQDFAQDALLLLRAVSPMGINIINADWNLSSGHPVSFPASSSIQITSGVRFHQNGHNHNQDYFSVTPDLQNPGKSLITFHAPNKPDIKLATIAPGESHILGRDLVIGSLFGESTTIKAGKSTIPAFYIRPCTDPNYDISTMWSRAAIMVVRQQDEIYVLDRGHLSELFVAKDFIPIAKYTPKPKKDIYGSQSFGASESL